MMESLPIQPVFPMISISPFGLLVLVVLGLVALKCIGVRFVLGGIAALVVMSFGTLALYHSLHFPPRQPVMIVHSEGWHFPQPPVPPSVNVLPLPIVVKRDQSKLLAQAPPRVIEISSEASSKEVEVETNAADADVGEKDVAEVPAAEPPADAESSAHEPRPAWVDAPPKRVGNVERYVVSSGPWKTFNECATALDSVIMGTVQEYMRTTFDAEIDSAEMLRRLGITESYVRQSICTDQYVETTTHDFAGIDEEMHNVHVLMEFDPAAQRYLEQCWNEHQQRENLVAVSLGGGGVFGLLALIYSLLKVDTWTKGYYSKRLLIGVPAVIAGIGLLIFAINAL